MKKAVSDPAAQPGPATVSDDTLRGFIGYHMKRAFNVLQADLTQTLKPVIVIDELERRDLIVRDRVPTDRRAYALRVTLAGRQLYEKAFAAMKEHENRMLEGLDVETCKTVVAALEAIQKHQAKG